MKTFLTFAILGLGSGAAYAILALGVVLIQRGSGTVNFAQGAVGMFAAYLFAHVVGGGTSEAVALVLVLLAAAATGAIWHVVVMKPLRRAPVLAKLVATLGLLTLLEGGAQLLWGNGIQLAPSLLPTGSVTVVGINVGEDRLWLLGITLALTAILWAWYKFSLFGISTRASAESERGAALLGFSPDLIAATNWGIGLLLGALAGILIAPIAQLSIGTLSLLILPGLAAALLGRFHSFAITAAAGIAIGVGQSLLGQYWSQTGVSDALPFVVVALAMVVSGRLIPARGTLAFSRPPLAPGRQIKAATWLVLAGLALLGIIMFDNVYKSALITSLVTVTAALSFIVVTGFVGQTSLMQLTFAGLGGLFVSKFATGWGIPFPWPVLMAAAAVVPIGIALGLPALRVRGINLAVVTMGAAVAINAVVFQNAAWTGGVQGSLVPSPSLFGFSLDPTIHPVRFGILIMVVTGALLASVVNLRRSGTGRRMLAVRANERAAAVSGINVSWMKLHAFALAAALAAVSGALLSYQIGAVSFDRFDVFGSIQLLTLVYIGGIAVVSGALIAGIAASGGVFYLLLQGAVPSLPAYYGIVSGALLILTVIANPDGAAIAMRRQWEWTKTHIHRLVAKPDQVIAAQTSPHGSTATSVEEEVPRLNVGA